MTQIVFQIATIACCIYTAYRIVILMVRKSRRTDSGPQSVPASSDGTADVTEPDNGHECVSVPPVMECIKEVDIRHPLISLYAATYLDCKPVGSRAQVYISKENHALIRRFLAVVAPNVPISGYVNKVVEEHLRNYRDEISQLHSDSISKPL